MVKKLSKFGNSQALIIDKAILELLNITNQTELKITTDGENIIIKPIRSNQISDDPKTQKNYEKIIKEYEAVLKKLAK